MPGYRPVAPGDVVHLEWEKIEAGYSYRAVEAHLKGGASEPPDHPAASGTAYHSTSEITLDYE